MNRRNFLRNAGTAVLTVTVLPAVGSAARLAPPVQHPSAVRPDGLMTRSTGYLAFDHSHELVIPMDKLKNPPAAGLNLRTSRAYLHTHAVDLTQAELQAIAAGETVTVIDSTIGEHSFEIQLKGGLSIR